MLQATVDRRALQRALRMLSFIRPDVPELRPGRYERLFTAHELITHRVDVGAVIDVKRAAMSAHVSQGGADDGERMLARFLQLPASGVPASVRPRVVRRGRARKAFRRMALSHGADARLVLQRQSVLCEQGTPVALAPMAGSFHHYAHGPCPQTW